MVEIRNVKRYRGYLVELCRDPAGCRQTGTIRFARVRKLDEQGQPTGRITYYRSMDGALWMIKLGYIEKKKRAPEPAVTLSPTVVVLQPRRRE